MFMNYLRLVFRCFIHRFIVCWFTKYFQTLSAEHSTPASPSLFLAAVTMLSLQHWPHSLHQSQLSSHSISQSEPRSAQCCDVSMLDSARLVPPVRLSTHWLLLLSMNWACQNLNLQYIISFYNVTKSYHEMVTYTNIMAWSNLTLQHHIFKLLFYFEILQRHYNKARIFMQQKW